QSVVVGDFNDDGKQDLAVANLGSSNVSILLGDGTGNFSAAANFGVAYGPHSIAVGDFNGDGVQDLAVAAQTRGSILLGDGKQDLVVANYDSNNVSVFLGAGASHFPGATIFGVGAGPYSVTVGDFNG